MQPSLWQPPVALSRQEEQVVTRIRRAKLFVFLHCFRHLLFDEVFQHELASFYRDNVRGRPPVPPALLALANILQAYTGVSDDEAVEASIDSSPLWGAGRVLFERSGLSEAMVTCLPLLAHRFLCMFAFSDLKYPFCCQSR